MTRRTYWGIGVLIVLLICVSVFLFEKYIDPEPKLLRKPPPGETYATGHWEGNKWCRRVPPDPETIFIDSKELDYYGIEGGEFSYEEMDQMNRSITIFGKHIIENYPYSRLALSVRYHRATRDENGERIYDPSILLPRYKEMLRYHRDSPRLLFDIAALLVDDSPAEAIKYGEEALKYSHLYSTVMIGGPERIHEMLGDAYDSVGSRNNMIGLLHQSVENYKSALVHLKAAIKLVEANPGRWRDSADIYIGWSKRLEKWIKRIEAGELLFGPPTSE